VEANREISIPALQQNAAQAVFTVKGAGLVVVTADIGFAGRTWREWTEALVRVRR